MPQLIITAIGPDRPGLVGQLTAHLHSAGGNLLDTRMVNLRGEFAMMILLELESHSAAQLQRDLPALGKPAKSKTKRDVFVFMINGYKPHAPAAAMALIERLPQQK